MSLKSGASARPAAVDAMTLRAFGFGLEQRAAARRVADAHGGRRGIEAGTNERDDGR